MEIALGVLALGVVVGGFSAFVAKQKNRDPVGWFLLGLLFSLFALIAVASVPPLTADEAAAARKSIAPEQTRPSTTFERMIGPVILLFAGILVILYLILK